MPTRDNPSAPGGMPFTLNLYVMEPGHVGSGARWGWNVAYTPTEAGLRVTSVNHTWLNFIEFPSLEHMDPRDYTPPGPRDSPGSIDAYVTKQQQAGVLSKQGTAVIHCFNTSGQLMTNKNATCSWWDTLQQLLPEFESGTSDRSSSVGSGGESGSGSGGGGGGGGSVEVEGLHEVWYGDGSYVRAAEVVTWEMMEGGEVVVMEAGAVLRNGNVRRVGLMYKVGIVVGVSLEEYPLTSNRQSTTGADPTS